jgi:hypothetical protein
MDASSDAATGAESTAHCVGYKHLIAFFLKQVQALAKKHNRKPAGWQEIFDHYVRASSPRRFPIDGVLLAFPQYI